MVEAEEGGSYCCEELMGTSARGADDVRQESAGH